MDPSEEKGEHGSEIIKTFATFLVAFVARPIGALLFGYWELIHLSNIQSQKFVRGREPFQKRYRLRYNGYYC